MNVSIPIDKTSAITAVRLTVLDGDLTNLNDNAVIGTTYIAELETLYCGVAIFVADATKPTALSEPDLEDIPEDGIPTGNYEIETTEDDIAESHTWDNQSEVEDNTIFNTDIVGIFQKYLPLAGGVMSGKITLDGDPTSANHAANKAYVDLFVSAVTGAGAIESSGGTTPEITIKDGTTAQKGAVQLEDSVVSTSTVKAATPASVKLAYDAATGVVSAHSDITSSGADIELAVVHKDADGSSHSDVVANTAAKHTQNTDTKLDNGGSNEVTALEAKTAYTHSQDTTVHLSAPQKTDLTDGGESVGHYHDSDRNRANHSGTQLMTTISDAGSLADKDEGDVDFDALGDGTTYKKLLATERTKLTGIATGADVTGSNAPQAHAASHADSDPLVFDTLPDGTTYKKFLATERTTLALIADVKNNLTSTDTDKPLSALQGKTLKDLFDSITQNIEDWICGTEDEVRTFFIDLYMYLTYSATIYYQAGGYFLVEYFWKNDAGFPSGMTAGSTWVTADLETAGYEVITISTSQSLLSIPKPDYGDAFYTGGLAGKATLVYHIKYVNALYETDFSQNELVDSFDPPDQVVTDQGFVDILAAQGANALTVIDLLADKIMPSDDSVVGRMYANSKKTLHRTNAGTPSSVLTPNYVGEECFDTTNTIWYKATGLTNTSWVALNS